PEAVFAGNVALGEVRGASRGFAPGTAESDLGAPGATPPVLYPPAGSPLVDGGDPAYAAGEDFNGTPRADGAPDVGAYERTSDENPGWPLGRGFRTPPEPPVVPDAGVPELDAGTAPGRDAGTPPEGGGAADAGSRTDAGSGAAEGGCGCRAGSRGGASFGLALLALARLVRRRRARRPPSPSTVEGRARGGALDRPPVARAPRAPHGQRSRRAGTDRREGAP